MPTYFDRKGLHNIKEETGLLDHKQKTKRAWKKRDKNEILKGVIDIQGDLDLSNLRFFSKGKAKDSPISAMGFGKIVANGLNIHIEHDFGKKKTFKLAVGYFAPIFTKILPNALQLLATSFFRIIDHLTEKNPYKQPSLADFNSLLEAYNYKDLNLHLSFNDLVIEDLLYLADKNKYFKDSALRSQSSFVIGN